MDQNNPYFKQVQLLVQVLPVVAKQECFALKGGTAINLFHRDLPRLSVDIDLVYLPNHERQQALDGIAEGLKAIKRELESNTHHEVQDRVSKDGIFAGLTISLRDASIKIEVNHVLRGTVHPIAVKRVSETVERQFGFAEMQVVDFNDLYAGKLCAALDRQHPRDLFDVKGLLENEGIKDNLKNTFLVYLLSHKRPAAELVAPNWQPINEFFAKEFEGMTEIPVSVDELHQARVEMLSAIKSLLTEKDKEFLIAFKQGKPDWESFAYPQVRDMPAIKWKLHNLEQMDKKNRQQATERLAAALND